MNDFIDRLKSWFSRDRKEVSVSKEAFHRYMQCVEEWNEHYFDDDWCTSDRGIDCKCYIDWFAEVHK